MKNLFRNRSKMGHLSEANKLQKVRSTMSGRGKDINSGDIISLAEGGCLLPPPPEVMKTALHSMADLSKNPVNIYQTDSFSLDFLDKVREFFEEEFQIKNSKIDNICVGYGVTHLFDLFIGSICYENDIILTPEGYYHSFSETPTKWGVNVLKIPTKSKNSHKITPEDLVTWLNSVTSQKKNIKAFMFSNPTASGAIYTISELKDLAQCLSEHGLAVFEDRIFYKGEFNPKDETPSILKYLDLNRDIAFTGYSASKVWGGANFRVGFGYGSLPLVSVMHEICHDSVIDYPFFQQEFGKAILNFPKKYLSVTNKENKKRKDIIFSEVKRINLRLKKIFNVKINLINIPFEPLAGQYVLLNFDPIKSWVTPLGKTIENNLDLSEYFLSLKSDGQAKGILVSSGYSKGHDDLSNNIAFSQLGYQAVIKAINQQVIRENKSFYWELDDYDYDALEYAFEEGRKKLMEGMKRIEYGLSKLQKNCIN